MFLLLSLLNVFQVLFRVKQELCSKIWIVMSDRVCGTVWASALDSGHLQSFVISPLTKCRAVKKKTEYNIWKIMLPPWQYQRGTNHCNVLGQQLHCTSLALYILILLLFHYYFPFFFSFSVLLSYLKSQYFNFFFLILSPIPLRGVEQVSGCVVFSYLPG